MFVIFKKLFATISLRKLFYYSLVVNKIHSPKNELFIFLQPLLSEISILARKLETPLILDALLVDNCLLRNHAMLLLGNELTTIRIIKNNHLREAEAHIIEACQKGDRKALNLLFEQYQSILFGICLRYAANETEAEDIFQEGMITINQKLYQYKLIGSFTDWLKKGMVNTCLQVLRSLKNIFTVTLLI